MYRLISRLLLLLSVVGACAPVLQAFSAEPPHACCLRKMHGSLEREPGLHDATPHRGNCCPPMTTPHSAKVQVTGTRIFIPHTFETPLEAATSRHIAGSDDNHSSRAPPAS